MNGVPDGLGSVADAQRFQRIVSDHHGAAGQQTRGEILQLQPRHGIEMGERFIHQTGRSSHSVRASAALAHAAGQASRAVVEPVGQTDLSQQPRPAPPQWPGPRDRRAGEPSGTVSRTESQGSSRSDWAM